jgi:methylamine utilization protein MauE
VTSFALAMRLAMAAALLWGGAEKARNLPAFASLLRQLGVSRGTRAIATAVVAAELGTAVSLMYGPSIVTVIAIVLLACVFAAAGLIAIRQKKRISCGCFGPYGGRQLGTDQLIAFPLWLAGAGVLWLADLPSSADSRAALAVAVPLTIAAIRSVSALRAAREARGDRRSARDMYRWLRT